MPPVDLVEVKRWADGDNELLLVTRLEQEPRAKARPASGLPVYDEDFYSTHYNKNSAKEFIKYARQVEQIVKRRGWELELKFNKFYCAFKAGFFIAFGVHWVGSKTFAFFVKLPEKEAKRAGPVMTRYENEWNQAVYFITPGTTKTSDYAPLFELAYRHLTGK